MRKKNVNIDQLKKRVERVLHPNNTKNDVEQMVLKKKSENPKSFVPPKSPAKDFKNQNKYQEYKPANTYEYKPADTYEYKPADTYEEYKPADTYKEYKPADTYEYKPADTYEYKPADT